MNVSSMMVKELREKTKYGMMECKKALVKANGDIEKAVEFLNSKSVKSSIKEREANEGIIEVYVHAGNKIGAIIELNCETDFVSNTSEFKDLAKNLLIQIVATNPSCISKEDLNSENDISSVLMEQKYIKDSEKTIKDLIDEYIKKFGENIVIKRFQRYEL